jgi:hypothetical protein
MAIGTEIAFPANDFLDHGVEDWA